jgi:hypothetical protein
MPTEVQGISGQMVYSDLEGGYWTLVTDSGDTFRLETDVADAELEILADEVVEVEGTLADEQMGIFMDSLPIFRATRIYRA